MQDKQKGRRGRNQDHDRGAMISPRAWPHDLNFADFWTAAVEEEGRR
jgi:hypothetical protein